MVYAASPDYYVTEDGHIHTGTSAWLAALGTLVPTLRNLFWAGLAAAAFAEGFVRYRAHRGAAGRDDSF